MAVFGINRGARLGDVLDGSSNTLMVAEYLTGQSNDIRGFAYTHRSGSQFLHAYLTPNTNAPDNLLDHPHLCFPEMNRPELNLPCVCGAGNSNTSASRSRSGTSPGGAGDDEPGHGILAYISVRVGQIPSGRGTQEPHLSARSRCAMEEHDVIRIPWAEPDLCEHDFRLLQDCLRTKWISQGPKVRTLEGLIASLSGRRYCVAVNSGTSALVAALMSLGVSRTSEVVIPAVSFIALPHAITMLGGIPVLADVDETSGVITPETVAPCVSRDTKAVVCIDYGGFAQDWEALHAECREVGVPLVVDAASSFLAHSNGRPAGASGDLAVFSFHAAKPITTGEGGAVVTDDEELASRLRLARNHGEIEGRKYFYQCLGGNFRMTDLAAALGISQVERRREILDRRLHVVDRYLDSAAMRAHAYSCHTDARLTSNGLTFTVILRESRDDFQRMLSDRGIETRSMWPVCVDEEPAYQGQAVKTPQPLERARRFSRTCLSLPVHCGIGGRELDHVISSFESVLEHIGRCATRGP